jgi:hypothetical protein
MPFVRPFSIHCAEHPPEGLPERSDPIRQDGLQGQVSAITLYLGRRLLLLFDRAELREQGEKIS